MSAELIDRIEVKKDGVYLSTHMPEDAGSYRTWRSGELSEAYQKDGQKGLDREMFLILYEYAALGGFHKSTERYRYVSRLPEAKALHRKCFDQIEAFGKSCQSPSEYRAFERGMRDKLYEGLAEKCGGYDQKHKNKEYER
ncbi:hypothetical protein NAU98_15570 [Clostridioides difficile]|nr:hypothetical protein [Clostridioides difficile]HBF7768604.1 hypothetical protein [Clostridioides difficile]